MQYILPVSSNVTGKIAWMLRKLTKITRVTTAKAKQHIAKVVQPYLSVFNLQLFEIKKLSHVINTLPLLTVVFYASPSEAPDAGQTQHGKLKRLRGWASKRGTMFPFRSQSWGKSHHKSNANWAQKSSVHVHNAEHRLTVDDQFGDVSSHMSNSLHRCRRAPLLTPLRMQKQRLLHPDKLPVFYKHFFLYTKCEGLVVYFIHVVVQLLNSVVLPMVTLCGDWPCPWKIPKSIHLYMSTLFSFLWKSLSAVSARRTRCPRSTRTFLKAVVDTSSGHLFHVWRTLKQEENSVKV